MLCAARQAPVCGLALWTLLLCAPVFAADPPAGCVPVARIVSIQGSIQIQRSGQSAWTVVRKLDTVVCQRDVLHAGPRSRTALLIDPETLVRLDQASTLSISQTPEETIVEFTKDPGLFQRIITAPNPCGAGYFISRFPRKFRVLTPFVNASVEGTEFLVAMRCESALVAVFEGRVRAEEVLAAASFSLAEGESVEAGIGQPAAMKLVVKPVDAVQWALYYPPLTEVVGDAAADQKCEQPDGAARSVCLVQRAEQRLRSGRVEEAEADVQTLLSLGLGDGDAYALLAIIQAVKNDKAAALDLANRATQLSPNSPRAWIALSYAHQAAFELEKALAAAKKAAELAPDSSTAQARVAELLMSVGRIRQAEKSAKAAVAANPNDSRAHMVLGFVHLAQINTKAAREDFLDAIERDSTEPLARLGLGLAIIRDGDLKAGREQIEIAVALDPTNSLLRSYVGKAYYEENTKERDHLAATQFGIAKRLDPNDPTPWFYGAILKDTQTRPVEALAELSTSTRLNDDRAVYRSRLLLDQDMAARGATTGTIYNELGFPRLGVVEAAESLAVDPANPSAHRFLSDIYATLPRHEIARASELLQAQLRQPLGAAPLQPQLANDILFKNAFFGPASVGLNEFNPLFLRNRAELQLFGLFGEHDTYGHQVIATGLREPFLFSLSGFGSHTDGYRANNDDTLRQYDGFAQVQLGADTSAQLEFTHAERTSGDLQSSFDPMFFSRDLRFEEELDTFRIGARQALGSRSDVLFSYIYQERSALLDDPDPVFPITFKSTQDSWKAEVQYLAQPGALDVIAGTGWFEGKSHEDGPFGIFDSQPDHFNAYAYLQVPIGRSGPRIQAGASYDHLDARDSGDLREVNPKAGFIWKPLHALTVRGAIFSVLKRRINSDQGLEPTQLAGFNQFYDDANGTVSDNFAVGLDLAISPKLSAGIELVERDLEVPFTLISGELVREEREETMLSAYLYWIAHKRLTVSFEPRYQRFQTGGQFGVVDLTEAPLAARLFFPSGFWIGASVTGVWEDGSFVGPTGTFFEGSDSFWVVDALVAYRLPRRLGTLTLRASNIFDESFQYQELALGVPPRYVPESQVLLQVSLSF